MLRWYPRAERAVRWKTREKVDMVWREMRRGDSDTRERRWRGRDGDGGARTVFNFWQQRSRVGRATRNATTPTAAARTTSDPLHERLLLFCSACQLARPDSAPSPHPLQSHPPRPPTVSPRIPEVPDGELEKLHHLDRCCTPTPTAHMSLSTALRRTAAPSTWAARTSTASTMPLRAHIAHPAWMTGTRKVRTPLGRPPSSN
jgi:hypothetical protein